MPSYAVLTAVGKDRPGLVDAISRFILDCRCNIEDSRMAILGGEFAMLILVHGEAAGVDKVLQGAAGAGEAVGLAIQARPTQPPTVGGEQGGRVPYQIEAYSADHPGIVQRLAHFLAERKINVTALETRVSHAPTTGMPLFSFHATVDVPVSEKIADLRRGLEAIAAEENLDVEVKPAG